MSQFKYLVSILFEKNKIEKEITVKMQFIDFNYSMVLRNHCEHEHSERIRKYNYTLLNYIFIRPVETNTDLRHGSEKVI